jgi:hypothetical protein
VSLASSQTYWQWRTSLPAYTALHDEDAPAEHLVQNIWHHQRIRRDELKLADGRTVRVLHPGFWNHGAGPDFAGAVLQFGSDAPVTGDVEVDLQSSGWRGHAHDRNPRFANVKLHVVWSGEAGTHIPTLVLKPFIDAPLAELSLWLASDAAKQFPAGLLGQCAGPLRDLSEPHVRQLLNEAALVRFQRKAHDLHARARQAGWDQALWEGMLRALGYKQNVWPMQRIGELRVRLRGERSLVETQARLLGVSGLLPDDLTRKQRSADSYLRAIWDHWWRERDSFADCVLPRSLWRLNGLRPANHPSRRLALAAHWAADSALFKRIEQWFTTKCSDGELVVRLVRQLQGGDDSFWQTHWTLRSARMTKAQRLLGGTRATDLAINVILPWFWVRAREGGNGALQAEAERRYFAWPAAEDNAVLRLARSRLLGGRRGVRLEGAAQQQGLLQIVRDFCQHSNALCADCRFPELIRTWTPVAP